jgi:hypothetical protein
VACLRDGKLLLLCFNLRLKFCEDAIFLGLSEFVVLFNDIHYLIVRKLDVVLLDLVLHES